MHVVYGERIPEPPLPEPDHGVRWICIAADLEHYSRRIDAGQIEAR